MTFFNKYTEYLEQQIVELKEQNRRLEDKNDMLVQALVPIIRKMNEPKIAAEILTAKKTHTIEKDDVSAKCSCGWHGSAEDPAELQELVAEHYKSTFPQVKGGRLSWPQIKTKLEAVGETSEKN